VTVIVRQPQGASAHLSSFVLVLTLALLLMLGPTTATHDVHISMHRKHTARRRRPTTDAVGRPYIGVVIRRRRPMPAKSQDPVLVPAAFVADQLGSRALF
jgi:hypothetical protein